MKGYLMQNRLYILILFFSCTLHGMKQQKLVDSINRGTLASTVSSGNLAAVQSLMEEREDSSDASEMLHIAAREGHLSIVQYLIKCRAEINAADHDGATPLFWATQNGHVEIVKFLVQQGAKVNVTTSTGDTPLHIAAQKGHLSIVEFLSGVEGIHIDARNIDGDTPLLLASQMGHREIVQLLIQHKANVNIADFDDYTPLSVATQENHIAITELLLQNGSLVNAVRKENGVSSLYLAAQEGYLELVKLLVQHGADINVSSKFGTTPLLIAIENGHIPITQFLMQQKASLAASHNGTPLFFAALRGHVEIVRILLALPEVDINKGNSLGCTPLRVAAQNGHLAVVKLLVENHADVHDGGSDGATPLLMAAQVGHHKIVQYLAEHGANINVKIKNGSFPLYMAAFNGHKDVVQLLLSLGADVNERYSSETPLRAAAEKGHLAIVRLMVENHADIHTGDSDGATPLFMAAQNGHQDIVQYLLSIGANVNQSCSDGTALHAAAKNGHIEIVRLLAACGAYINAPSTVSHDQTPVTTKKRECLDSGAAKILSDLIKKYKLIKHAPTLFYKLLQDHNYDGISIYIRFLNATELEECLNAAILRNTDESFRLFEQLLALCKNYEKSTTIAESGIKGILNPVCFAASCGNFRCIEKLLQLNVNPNIQCDRNSKKSLSQKVTPLILAIENNHFECVELLLKNKADANLFTDTGNNALVSAVTSSCDTAMIDLLIKYGNLQESTLVASLVSIASTSMNDKKSQLVAHLLGLIDIAKHGQMLLDKAKSRGNTRMIGLLQLHGAKSTALDIKPVLTCDLPASTSQSTVQIPQDPQQQLYEAIKKDDCTTMQQLIEQVKININIPTTDGKVPLNYAMSNDYLIAAETLLKCGARPNIFDGKSKTAWLIAVQALKEKPRLMKLLLQYYPERYQADCHGNTALHYILDDLQDCIAKLQGFKALTDKINPALFSSLTQMRNSKRLTPAQIAKDLTTDRHQRQKLVSMGLVTDEPLQAKAAPSKPTAALPGISKQPQAIHAQKKTGTAITPAQAQAVAHKAQQLPITKKSASTCKQSIQPPAAIGIKVLMPTKNSPQLAELLKTLLVKKDISALSKHASACIYTGLIDQSRFMDILEDCITAQKSTPSPAAAPAASGIRALFGHQARSLEDEIIENIEHERSAISISSCMFTNIRITEALIRALKLRRIAIKILVDNSCDEYYGTTLGNLLRHGAQIKTVRQTEYLHSKYVIFDSLQTIIAGSANFTRAGMTANYENMIESHQENTVLAFKTEFDWLWSRADGYSPSTSGYQSPELIKQLISQCKKAESFDLIAELQEQLLEMHCCPHQEQAPATTSASEQQKSKDGKVVFSGILQTILQALNKKPTSIQIAAFALTDKILVEELKAAAINPGTTIDILIDHHNRDERVSEELGGLRNVHIRIFQPAAPESDALMHHKFMLLGHSDRTQTVLTGSCNFTTQGLTGNREFMIRETNQAIVAAYQQEFDRLWSQGLELR